MQKTIMKTRWVESAFGGKFVQSPLSDEDWDRMHFNLKLRESMGNKAISEHRNFNRDERKFIAELHAQDDAIRRKYFTEEEIWGLN